MSVKKHHDIMFKDATSVDHRRRILSLREVFADKHVLARRERRTVYVVVQHTPIQTGVDPDLLAQEIEEKQPDGPPRQISVLRVVDGRGREEKLVYRVTGNFSVVTDGYVLQVSYAQSLRYLVSKRSPDIPS